ncbi:hypothetical protein NRF20_05610 [Streptomyces sp. R-74717]|uniref:hypothetical protein n=1 Tax=Streptomyces TaxID=1883 RepID=UPI003794FAC1
MTEETGHAARMQEDRALPGYHVAVLDRRDRAGHGSTGAHRDDDGRQAWCLDEEFTPALGVTYVRIAGAPAARGYRRERQVDLCSHRRIHARADSCR